MPTRLTFLKLNSFTTFQKIILFILFSFYLYYRIVHRFTEYWQDEFVTCEGMTVGFLDFVTNYIPKHEYHLPGPFILLYPLGHLFGTKNAFLFSAPYLVVNIFLFILVLQIDWAEFLNLNFSQKIKKWINIATVFFVTFNIHLVIHTLEVRPYSVLSFLMILSLLTVNLARKSIQKNLVLFVSFVIGLFHNYGLLMLGLCFLYFLISDLLEKPKVKTLKQNFLKGKYLIAGMSIAFVLLLSYMQLPVFEKFDLHHFDYIDPHQYIKQGMKGIIQVVAILYGFMGPLKMIRVIFLVCIVAASLSFIYKKIYQPFCFLFIFIVLPLLIMYAFSVSSGYYFVQRQFVWVMPFWAVFNSVCFFQTVQLIRKFRA